MLTSFIEDRRLQASLVHAITEIPTVKAKAQWSMRWIGSYDASFATRLIAFAAVEGIFFSSSFASIYWLKKKGVMPGFCYSNELISRDEGMHTQFACLLLQYIENKPPTNVVHQIIDEAVKLEISFASGTLFSIYKTITYQLLH